MDFEYILVSENQLRLSESISAQLRELISKHKAAENVNGNETISEKPAIHDDRAVALPSDLGQNCVPDGKQCIKITHNPFCHIEVLIVGNFPFSRYRKKDFRSVGHPHLAE